MAKEQANAEWWLQVASTVCGGVRDTMANIKETVKVQYF